MSLSGQFATAVVNRRLSSWLRWRCAQQSYCCNKLAIFTVIGGPVSKHSTYRYKIIGTI